MKKLFLNFLFIFISLFAFSQKNLIEEHLIWYNTPAESWKFAQPVGNGRIGAMVFGNPAKEHLQLNDDSLWPGDPGWDLPEGNPSDLQEIREALFEGNNVKADSLFVAKFSNKTIVRSHQTLGDLFLDFNFKKISDYRRQLDIDSSIMTVSYKTKGNKIEERIFTSHPHDVIVVSITSEKKGGLNGKIRISRPEDNGNSTVKVFTENNLLKMDGEVTQYGGKFRSEPFPIKKGVKFETVIKVDNKDGKIIAGNDFLELKKVSKAIIYILNNTSYYHNDYKEQNQRQLSEIENAGFEKILSDHVADYQNLYKRVSFKIEAPDYTQIPTDKRTKKVKKGNNDIGLETLLFQYGRYLLISSSRPGTNPANLQGLWNRFIEAPWNADYHLNINLQMNYWPADVTGLSELNYPLFDFTDKLFENGKEVAKKNFGCRGSFAPHATDLWAPAWLRAPTAYWGCSVGAGGWIAHHYWDYFAFTRDTSFLKERVYPALKNTAQFYSDWLITDPRDGTLISAPSTSPENRFYNDKGEKVATCLGSAMDQQIIHEVFTNYLNTCKILNINDSLTEKVKKQLKKLRPGFVVGSDGRILEWDREYKETEPGHRHMSHIYGFYPGNQISKDSTPELFKAVKKTIDYRLEHGGAGPGWSRAWLISLDARMQQGNEAEKNIKLFIKKSLYPNMFCAHPPFQIDGNFGFTAGVAEMLLQSFEKDVIRILPALPSDWKTGHIKGLKARGSITTDIYWENNKATKVILTSKYPVKFKMIVNGKVFPVELKGEGDKFVWEE